MVATSDTVASQAVSDALVRLRGRTLFGALDWKELTEAPTTARELGQEREPAARDEPPRGGSTGVPTPTRIWGVQVHAGSEQAILREIEYRVARALELAGDYVGLPARLSLDLARQTIAAQQVRTVGLNGPKLVMNGPMPSANVWPFIDREAHERYRTAMGLSTLPTELPTVHVALLDAKPRPEVELDGSLPDTFGEIDGFADDHVTATMAIIRDLAPVRITPYTVVGTGRPVGDTDGAVAWYQDSDELAVAHALISVRSSDAIVVVMPFRLDFDNGSRPRTWRTVIEQLLPDLGPDRVVIASAGNDDPGHNACFPGYASTVIMVGAVDESGGSIALRGNSSYLYPAPGPALHVVAPSGAGALGAAVGTSAAAAYAAGVIARVIAKNGMPHCSDSARVFRSLLAQGADRRSPFDDALHYGRGLIREITYDADQVEGQVSYGSVPGEAEFRQAWDKLIARAGRQALIEELEAFCDQLEREASGDAEAHAAVAELLRALDSARRNAVWAVRVHLRRAGGWALTRAVSDGSNVTELLRAAATR